MVQLDVTGEASTKVFVSKHITSACTFSYFPFKVCMLIFELYQYAELLRLLFFFADVKSLKISNIVLDVIDLFR